MHLTTVHWRISDIAISICLLFISKTLPALPIGGDIIYHVNVYAMLISTMTKAMDQQDNDNFMLQEEFSDLVSPPPS